MPVLHADEGADPNARENTHETRRLIEIGTGYVDDSSFRFGKYSGLTDEGWVPLLNVMLESRPVRNSGETSFWKFEGNDLGFDSRRVLLQWGRQGTDELRIAWRESPKYQSNSGATPFLETAPGQLVLPANWSASGDLTSGMPALTASLGSLEIREQRRRFELGYVRELAQGWQAAIDFDYENRDGRRAIGGMFGSNGGNSRAAFLPLPVDDTTQRFGLKVARQTVDYLLTLSYEASSFNQSQNAVEWQNPFGAHPQWAPGAGFPDGRGLLALDPDNRFQQLQLGSSFRLGEASTASLVIARGRYDQDDTFFDYTVNSLLTVETPLPRSSLDGRIDTTLLDFRLTSRLSPRLHLATSFRLDDRDNKTPVAAYRYVPSDSQPQIAIENSRLNRPYSYSEQRFASDLRYRVARGVQMTAGFRFRDRQRDFSEVNNTEEFEYVAGMRWNRSGDLALSVDYLHNNRNIDSYIGNRPLLRTRLPGTVDAEDFENHPLLRKYYLAARDRDQVRLRADLNVGTRVTLGWDGSYSRDTYDDTIFGLNESRVRSWNADASWSPSGYVHTLLHFGVDRYTSEQAGRAFTVSPVQVTDPNRNWFYDSRDRFESAGLDIRFEQAEKWLGPLRRDGLTGGLDFVLELRHAHSRGAIDVATGTDLAVEPLPDFFTRLNSIGFNADYGLDEASSLRFGILHEHYRSADFALDDVAPATIPAVLTTGDSSPQYRINWIVFAYRRTF